MAKKPQIKTEWDLKLLYKSDKDPAIQSDVDEVRRLCEKFEKKYKGKTDWLEDENALFEALSEYEGMMERTEGKPIYYYYYRKDLDSTDRVAESKLNKLMHELTEYGNRLVFFTVELGCMPKDRQERFLASAKLEPYRYFLKTLFDKSAHVLSEPEEKILNLKSLPAHTMWVQATEKFESRRTVKHDGKEMPLPEAMGKIHGLPTAKRRALHKAVMERLKEVAEFAEAEINAVYTDKKISDQLRGYKEPYSATILGYENEEETVAELVAAVTKRFDISKKFFALKRKLLGLPHLEYADRGVSIGETKEKIPFDRAYAMLLEVFGKADPEFREVLERFVANGQVDVFPRKGKTGGAYCSHSRGAPTFVLLNHVDDLRSYTTFAHEMGHALHSEYSKGQPPMYQDYTISAAEVASTLLENFAFEHVFETLSEKDKVIALHNKINDAVSTIFRQIACFNFELELHRAIREKGSISAEEIAKLMNRHMASYIGPAMKFNELDGYFFVTWSHIRRFFYVYSYAFGHLVSSALYRTYKEDPAYMSKIKQFLKAGGSKCPEDIFADAGIDVRDPKFWEEGLREIEEDIKRLEKLTKK